MKQENQNNNDLPKLAAPAQRALANAGYLNLEQLTKVTEADLASLHGMGPNALGKIREALKAKGLSFARVNPIGKVTAAKKVSRLRRTDDTENSKTVTKNDLSSSQHIDKQIKELNDWRGNLLARLRKLILETAPEITEDWKWDTAVWVWKGNVVAGGVFKGHVKLNFFKGAALPDPKRLFNAGLDAKASRGIDFSESAEINEVALKELIRAAVSYNMSGSKKK